MDKNQGYSILKAVMLENGRGFALGHHPTAPSPYVTWACYDDKNGQRQYEWGHYGNDLTAMEQDFSDRVKDYQRLYHVGIVQTEAPGLYKYYSTQRPVDIGTFPKPPHNAPDEIVNYDRRIPVEGGAFLAWGHLTYTRPLTEKEASDYELWPRPAGAILFTRKRPPTGATDRRICMEERYNSMKSAEIATEHNYNMLDGVLNNQAPPPEEKELDKVKEPPHKRRSREREER